MSAISSLPIQVLAIRKELATTIRVATQPTLVTISATPRNKEYAQLTKMLE
jgi:hypothetical protein